MQEKVTVEDPEATDEKKNEPITGMNVGDDNNVDEGEINGIHQEKRKWMKMLMYSRRLRKRLQIK